MDEPTSSRPKRQSTEKRKKNYFEDEEEDIEQSDEWSMESESNSRKGEKCDFLVFEKKIQTADPLREILARKDARRKKMTILTLKRIGIWKRRRNRREKSRKVGF